MSLKQEYKLLEALNDIFNDEHNTKLPEKDYFVLCPANVCLCVAKSDKAKKWILRFIDSDNSRNKDIPNLSMLPEKLEEQKAVLSMEYMEKIMKVLGKTDDRIKITIRKDYPAIIENEDFKFVLAPRIENE